jgi:hypothetical protein
VKTAKDLIKRMSEKPGASIPEKEQNAIQEHIM